MAERQLTIGLVEDNPGDARLIQKMLGEPQAVPFRVDLLSRLDETLDRVGREPFDVLLLDLGLPDSQGLATFDRVIQQAPTMPVIIVSGAIDEQLAVEAVARGAQDYLVKGHIDSPLLKRAIRYAIERKRAEQVLLQRERALLEQNVELERREREGQRYLDTAEVILLALDFDGRITLVNRYACAILGRTADDLCGRDWIETCVPARVHGALRTTFRNLLAGDLSIVENPILTRSGEERLIAWRNTLLLDDAGHVVGTFSSGSDITERKRAEDEIQLQRLRVFKATMRTVQDIVNNLLNTFQLVRLEAEGQMPAEILTLVDGTIEDAAVKLKTLGDLETIKEKEMAIGLGIEYPSAES